VRKASDPDSVEQAVFKLLKALPAAAGKKEPDREAKLWKRAKWLAFRGRQSPMSAKRQAGDRKLSPDPATAIKQLKAWQKEISKIRGFVSNMPRIVRKPLYKRKVYEDAIKSDLKTLNRAIASAVAKLKQQNEKRLNSEEHPTMVAIAVGAAYRNLTGELPLCSWSEETKTGRKKRVGPYFAFMDAVFRLFEISGDRDHYADVALPVLVKKGIVRKGELSNALRARLEKPGATGQKTKSL
jgi:hypothetical protein